MNFGNIEQIERKRNAKEKRKKKLIFPKLKKKPAISANFASLSIFLIVTPSVISGKKNLQVNRERGGNSHKLQKKKQKRKRNGEKTTPNSLQKKKKTKIFFRFVSFVPITDKQQRPTTKNNETFKPSIFGAALSTV